MAYRTGCIDYSLLSQACLSFSTETCGHWRLYVQGVQLHASNFSCDWLVHVFLRVLHHVCVLVPLLGECEMKFMPQGRAIACWQRLVHRIPFQSPPRSIVPLYCYIWRAHACTYTHADADTCTRAGICTHSSPKERTRTNTMTAGMQTCLHQVHTHIHMHT